MKQRNMFDAYTCIAIYFRSVTHTPYFFSSFPWSQISIPSDCVKIYCSVLSLALFFFALIAALIPLSVHSTISNQIPDSRYFLLNREKVVVIGGSFCASGVWAVSFPFSVPKAKKQEKEVLLPVLYGDFGMMLQSNHILQVIFSSEGSRMIFVDQEGVCCCVENILVDPRLLQELLECKVCVQVKPKKRNSFFLSVKFWDNQTETNVWTYVASMFMSFKNIFFILRCRSISHWRYLLHQKNGHGEGRWFRNSTTYDLWCRGDG